MSRKLKKKTLFFISMVGLPILAVLQYFSRNTTEATILTEDQLRNLIATNAAMADVGGGGPGGPGGDAVGGDGGDGSGDSNGDCPEPSDCPGDPSN